jgi:hypothetical protein
VLYIYLSRPTSEVMVRPHYRQVRMNRHQIDLTILHFHLLSQFIALTSRPSSDPPFTNQNIEWTRIYMHNIYTLYIPYLAREKRQPRIQTP